MAGAETASLTLELANPKLWWPNGYGEQHLYDVEVSFTSDGKTSDVKKVKSGVREMSYTVENNILDIFVNGRMIKNPNKK